MNILVFGKAGIGKCTIVQEFIEQKEREQNTKDYFKIKWNSIPYVEKYIDLLIEKEMSNCIIDQCLCYIAYNLQPVFIATLVGRNIAEQIFALKEETPYKYGKHAKEVK